MPCVNTHSNVTSFKLKNWKINQNTRKISEFDMMTSAPLEEERHGVMNEAVWRNSEWNSSEQLQ